MRVLIAGCGALGVATGRVLAARGDTVFGLRRHAAGLPDAVAPVEADLLRPESLRALPGALDAVVYMPTPDSRDEAGYEATYVRGLEHLLEALGAAPARLVYVSSTSVYGQSDGSWVDEDSATEPARFNGRLVLAGEAVARATGGVALRLGGIYGPGRSRLLARIRAGEHRVQREPPRYTNRIHREDAAEATARLVQLESPAPAYVGVDDAPVPEAELGDWLAAQLGVPPPAEKPPPDDPATARGKRCANTRLRAAGWTPRYPSYREGYGALLDEPGAGASPRGPGGR